MPRRTLLSVAVAASLLAVPSAHAATAPPLHQPGGKAACVTDREKGAGATCRLAPAMRAPTAAVVDPSGRHVYVAASRSDRIVRLRRTGTPTRGGLRYAACTGAAAECATAPALHDVRALAISDDGRWVAAVSRAGQAVSLLRRWRDGELEPRSCLAAAPAASADTADCLPTAALRGATRVAFAPGGDQVYVVRGRQRAVSLLTRDGDQLAAATGPGSCVVDASRAQRRALRDCASTPGLRGAGELAISADGRNVYVVGRGDDAVVALRRTTDGLLRPIGCIADAALEGCDEAIALADPAGIAVAPDGQAVYVTSMGESSLSAFSRDARGGLSPIGCYGAGPLLIDAQLCVLTPQLMKPDSVVAVPDGLGVFVGDAAGSTVSFGIRQHFGDLVMIEPPNGCINQFAAGCMPGRGLGAVSALAAMPDANGVYAVSRTSHTVTVVRQGGR